MFRICITIFCLFTLVPAGCERRDTSKSITFEQEPTDYTLLIIADIDVIKSSPRAFEFVSYAVDHYFRERVGTHDQIIISQLSGNKRPLLFQGTVRDLRRDMPTAEHFRQYLVSRSDPGRRVNVGIAESLDFVMKTHGVKHGAAPVALIVSSMIDDEPESKEIEDRLMNSLISFGRQGGQMAFYFCDQQKMAVVEDRMTKAGFGWEILECDIHGRRDERERTAPILERERRTVADAAAQAERERHARTDDARAEAVRFYEEHSSLLSDAIPLALFRTQLQNRFPEGVTPEEAWLSAQEMIAEMLPLIAAGRERQRLEKEEDRRQAEQEKRTKKKIAVLERQIERLTASASGDPETREMEVAELQRQIQQLQEWGSSSDEDEFKDQLV